jgi:hypothetical protein
MWNAGPPDTWCHWSAGGTSAPDLGGREARGELALPVGYHGEAVFSTA